APFIFQVHLGLTAAQYGTWILLPAGGYFLGNLLSNRLIKMVENNYIILMGSLMVIFGGLFLIFMHHETVIRVILPITWVTLGVGLVLPIAMANSITPFRSKAGTAAALAGFLQIVGSSLTNGFVNFIHLTSAGGLGLCFTLFGMIVLIAIV